MKKFDKEVVMEAVESLNAIQPAKIYSIFTNGKVKKLNIPIISYPKEHQKIMEFLDKEECRIFECWDCCKECSYNELYAEICDFETDSYVCRACYNKEVGEWED